MFYKGGGVRVKSQEGEWKKDERGGKKWSKLGQAYLCCTPTVFSSIRKTFVFLTDIPVIICNLSVEINFRLFLSILSAVLHLEHRRRNTAEAKARVRP